MRVSGQHVFITGGGSGIGLALAREFLRHGNQVTVCGRDAEKLEQAARDNPGLAVMAVDISREDGLQSIADGLAGKLSSVTILVNNAAIGDPYCLLRDPLAFGLLEQELETDLLAPIKLTRYFLPLLCSRPETAIVNVTSGFALWPCPVVPGYSISKAGLRAFTRILRHQLHTSGVRVFEIIPPLVETPLVKRVKSRKITPEKVAIATLDGMARNISEVCIGEIRLLQWGKRLCPGLVDRLMLRYPISLGKLDKLYPPDDKRRPSEF